TYVKRTLAKDKKYKEFLNNTGIHLHVPAGAVPKDGPSAGITMATSLFSLATHKKIKKQLAMTGELTLSGAVLPVGGIKEKVIAAKRNGCKEVILPKQNMRDLKEIPTSVKKGLKIHLVKNISEVLRFAFPLSP